MKDFISIIVPALNAAGCIDLCLNALVNLDYPKDQFEIIIVDNGSTDNTLELAKKYSVKIITKTNCTISSLRNFGARQAKGDILAFIDSDCIAPHNWLKDTITLLNSRNDIGAVGAQYSLPEETTWVERTWHLHINKVRVNSEVNWLPSCNMIMLRHYFIKLGGFKEELTTSEDFDFGQKIRKAGLKLISEPRLSVIHLRNPKSTKEFFIKESWRGKGVMQNFMSSFPKMQLNNALLFAFFNLLCLFGLVIGAINIISKNSWSIFIFFLTAIFLPSLVLALKNIIRDYKWYYLFPLAYLYFVYGMARAISILDIRNYRSIYDEK